MGLQHHQPRLGSLLNLWLGTFSPLRGHRGRRRHLCRSQHWSGLSILSAPARYGAHPNPASADSFEPRRFCTSSPRLAHWYFAIRYRPHKLDRPRAHRELVRRGGFGRLHNCHPHRHIRYSPILGTQQCRRNAGGPEPRSQTARARRNIGMAYRLLQHAFPRCSWSSFHYLRGTRCASFHSGSGGVPLAASCLRIISYGNIGYAYGMVMLQAFNGAGDTVTPIIVNFFGFWLLEIPLAYWLAIRVGMRSSGVFYSIVIAEAAIAAASALLFKLGRWKRQRI